MSSSRISFTAPSTNQSPSSSTSPSKI